MPLGNADNLRAAASRKSEHAHQRADAAIRTLVKRGDPITFRGVATEAGCSPDFLYNSPTLRPRIEGLRASRQATSRAPEGAHETGSVQRTLTTQIANLKKQHRDEIEQLRTALAAAHGELLQLRRERRPAGHAGG